MVPKPPLGALCALSLALSVASGLSNNAERIQPNHEHAINRANMVFNAIHSAGRQWGSSLYHNGFGLFPAIVPQGALFYHGARQNVTPPGPEWLAFEIEHAENFATSIKSRPGKGRVRPPPKDDKPGKQKPMAGEEFREELRRREDQTFNMDGDDLNDEDGPHKTENYRGYLHTYQANRDLNVLLVDGMSAGKTAMGTLDTQDLLLRENTTSHDVGGWDEWRRALDLCDIATEWGYDGFVRVEIGFEIIHCNFSMGVDLVSMTRTEMPEDWIGKQEMSPFQWARAVAERYNDIGGDRLRIDYSSMVSGLFFPINISSSDVDRPDLLRLGAATLGELKDIKAYLKDIATQPRRFTVNWQGLVDLIVSRFNKRLVSMAYESLPSRHFIGEIEGATLTWVDAPALPDDVTLAQVDEVNGTAEAIERCRKHFLRPALLAKERWSREDDLIHTSIDTVMKTICRDIFSVRSRLLEASGSSSSGYRINREYADERKMDDAVQAGRVAVQQLVNILGWTTWKQSQPCAPDEVLFIAMWPFGEEEDHWNPGCRSVEQIKHPSNSYWNRHFGPPKPKPSKEA
ncbi:hypothetical protein FZEAL_6066 [Fusarium zealandicum]|uniref:Uncharacterized protein n=1 Tax=Fusarium zealandicum TaxID=1053134 RepID=A0A8H4UJ83_9HYPO|nr:hypothetical protein FZEAL_6066 [Fusarium zealandicum]